MVNFDLSTKLFELSLMALPFLFAVTMREALRGYMANRMGDPTVKQMGRLSLNPLNHADPIWTGVVPVVAFVFLSIPILLGQAKPVEINPLYFKDMKKGLLAIAISGPVSLLSLAIFWALVVKFGIMVGVSSNNWLIQTSYTGVYLSSIFCVIGLLPIPPLDGGKILEYLLPEDAAEGLRTIEPFGFFIVIGIFIFAKSIILVPAYFLFALIVRSMGL